jgi:hypothetical protein
MGLAAHGTKEIKIGLSQDRLIFLLKNINMIY